MGGGVIGLAVAWRLARAGRRVTLCERDQAGQGTSRVAAGMITPAAEAGFEDHDLVRFSRMSLARYPAFVAELQDDASTTVPFALTGSLEVALNHDDATAMRRSYQHRVSAGLPVEWLTGTRAREIEPSLSPRTSAAMWNPGDGHVDTLALVTALARACRARGVELRERCEVERLTVENGVVTGVRARGEDVPASTVVVAAGAWSGELAGLPAGCAPPVRPVRGQIVRLRRTNDFALAHIVRSPRAYVLPRADGSVIAGATQEEAGFDPAPTAGGVREILEGAWEAVPSIQDLPFERVETGFRPATRTHRPVIGPSHVRGLVFATGHFRHGIALAPATADAVCEGIVSGRFGAEVAAFSPQRQHA